MGDNSSLTIVGVNLADGSFKTKDYTINTPFTFNGFWIRPETNGATLQCYNHNAGTNLYYVSQTDLTPYLDEVISLWQ
jgi:hypothetical protein